MGGIGGLMKGALAAAGGIGEALGHRSVQPVSTPPYAPTPTKAPALDPVATSATKTIIGAGRGIGKGFRKAGGAARSMFGRKLGGRR